MKKNAQAGLVAIGASAGGLEALSAVLGTLPEDFPWPVVIAQHMDPTHESQFAAILQRTTKLSVQEAKAGEKLLPSVIYTCPANAEISILPDRSIQFRAPVAGRPQRIDHLFSSLAKLAGPNMVGVILSGTGSDGARGALAIKRSGGVVVVESESTARQFGMPSAAIQAGAVDYVRPSNEIGPLLGRIISGEMTGEKRMEFDDIREILDLLKARRGTTFDQYRMATLRRRIRKRMIARSTTTVDQYLDLLKKEPSEQDVLFDTLLINVTEFFRDLDAWESLAERVIPQLVERHRAGEEIRVWCPGVSSGEEAYSIAMLISEALGADREAARVKIFATDIDTAALAEGRAGRFDNARVTNVSSERLAQFFQQTATGFEVSKPLRNMVIFGVHDLGRDPPIGRLDLIICRNVLIYFDLPLQRRVFAAFHYALSPSGALFLGASEALPRNSKGFDAVDRHAHIFRRTPTTPTGPSFLDGPAGEQRLVDQASRERAVPVVGSGSLLDIILETPNFLAIVLDADRVIRFANRYASSILSNSPATVTGRSLDDLVTSATAPLLEGIDQAMRLGRRTHAKNVKINIHRRAVTLDVTYDPFKDPDGRPFVLLAAHDVTLSEEARRETTERARENREAIETLQSTNEEMQSTNEELVTANEELQSANEELTTLNEEVQSMNEELETTNEELQSTNEELGAVNAELNRASSEVARLDMLLRAALDGAPDAIIILDANGVVVRWGGSASHLLQIRAEDTLGRNIHALNLGIESGVLRDTLTRAATRPGVATTGPIRGAAPSGGERWLSIAARRVEENSRSPQYQLVVIRDMTHVQAAQRGVAAATARYFALLRGTREAVIAVGRDGHVAHTTAGARAILGVDLAETQGRLWTSRRIPPSYSNSKARSSTSWTTPMKAARPARTRSA